MNEIQTTNEKEQYNALAQDFNLILLLKFAFPSIITMILMGLYTTVDSVFIARFVNIDALSAINIVCPVINITVGIGIMLATGGSAIIARKMGAGEEKQAKQDFTLIIIVGALIGVCISGFGLIFIDEIIMYLGASKILYPYCKEYLFIMLIFVPASILQLLFQSLIVTAGKPELGMVLSICAGVTNIVLDYVFIVVLEMGVSGAAWGTGIGYLIPTVLGIVFFSRKNCTLHFCKPNMDFKIIIESCLNGSSEMIGQIAAAVSTFLFNITMMRLLGEDGVAAITIIIFSEFLLTSLYIGFSMGIAPVISYNYGSENHEKLKKIFGQCIISIGIVTIFIFAFSMIFSSTLVGVFSPKGSEVYKIAREGFLIFPIGFLFCGFNIFASATFTALSNGKVSAIISFLRTFVFIIVALIVLPIYLKITGVWIAVPLAEFLTFILSCGFIVKYRNRYHYF